MELRKSKDETGLDVIPRKTALISYFMTITGVRLARKRESATKIWAK